MSQRYQNFKRLWIYQIYLTFYIPEIFFCAKPVEFCIMNCMNVLNKATLLLLAESTIKWANGTWDVQNWWEFRESSAVHKNRNEESLRQPWLMPRTIRAVGRHAHTCIHHGFRKPTKLVCLFVITHHAYLCGLGCCYESLRVDSFYCPVCYTTV